MAPDEALVDQARKGDLEAFETLVDRHTPVVMRVAARVVGPDEAADVAQDAFLRAFHRLDRWSGEGSFRSWLLAIARNTAVTTAMRRRADPAPPDELDEEPAGDGDRTPAERLETRERSERLAQKLRLLRNDHRVVLVLRDVEGLSYDEIAEVTGAPLGSVKGRLHRARAELIDLLRRNTYDWELPG